MPPGDVLGSNVETIYFIRSENAHNIARTRGFWDVVRGRIAGRSPYLLSFLDRVGDPGSTEARYLGMRTIATKDISGNLGRERECSGGFLPVGGAATQKERWRQCHTRLLSGATNSPVQVCRVGGKFFVVNGHHRVSVARYHNLKSIRAYVSEVEEKTVSESEGDPA
jgi:hypothetical protein